MMINSRTMLTWFIIGATWNILNLWLLYLIIKATFSQAKKMGRIVLLLFLKFPLLYTAGYFILTYWNPSLGGLIFGFSIPLLIASVWMVGRSMNLTRLGYDKGALANRAGYPGIFRNIKGQ